MGIWRVKGPSFSFGSYPSVGGNAQVGTHHTEPHFDYCVGKQQPEMKFRALEEMGDLKSSNGKKFLFT